MIKKIFVALALIMAFGAIGTYGILNQPLVESVSLGSSNNGLADLKANQQFCTEFKYAGSDAWINLGCKKNVITTAGLNFVEFLLGTGANSPVKYLALGNGSAPTTASTTLNQEQTDCGLGRATGTTYDLGDGWWEVNTTFTYSCSVSRVVNNTANFNATSSGTMYAGGTITTVTFTTNGDQLKLRHNFTFSEA